jgi:hypothetical protein
METAIIIICKCPWFEFNIFSIKPVNTEFLNGSFLAKLSLRLDQELSGKDIWAIGRRLGITADDLNEMKSLKAKHSGTVCVVKHHLERGGSMMDIYSKCIEIERDDVVTDIFGVFFPVLNIQ